MSVTRVSEGAWTDGGFHSHHKTGIENIQMMMSEVCMANVQVTEMSE